MKHDKTSRFVRLGASLYVPATRDDLLDIVSRQRYPHLRSVIFCTEDAVLPKDLPRALLNLQEAIPRFPKNDLLRFVRVRSPQVLEQLLAHTPLATIDGFVLPKVTVRNLPDYMQLLAEVPNHDVMLTLETAEVFELECMLRLRDQILEHGWEKQVLALRIGGNDLLNLLGIRRNRLRTIYETPVGLTIAQLVTAFKPWGFNLTAPVFEYLDQASLLAEEVGTDLDHGLLGKTAIHPTQVELIEALYQVSISDLEMALSILQEDAPAVFRLHNAMCEPATHTRWAEIIRARADVFGVVNMGRHEVECEALKFLNSQVDSPHPLT